MTYKQAKNLKEREFKRLCGVKPKHPLFEYMRASPLFRACLSTEGVSDAPIPNPESIGFIYVTLVIK